MIFQCLPDTHNDDREGAAQQEHEEENIADCMAGYYVVNESARIYTTIIYVSFSFLGALPLNCNQPNTPK